jgi:hypothetical protein
MKKALLLLLCLRFLFTEIIFAEDTDAFRLLRLNNAAIKNNDTINEMILDLVNVSVKDSVIYKKRQHHRLFLVGWTISAFAGYNWRPVEFTKQKFVGTVERSSRSNSAQFTEHDVNFDLYFFQRKYLWKVFKGYDKQREIKRQDFRRGKHLKDYTVSPFIRDTNNIDRMQYRLHAELTPPDEYRRQLNELFYPVFHDRNLATHPNFKDSRPGMGFYGVYCSDCNHSCHNELHPYEWIWWLNTSDSLSSEKNWVIGLFKESSNRFPDWSKGPKQGRIEIPFSIKKDGNATITIHPLAFGKLIENGAFEMIPSGVSASSLNSENRFLSVLGTQNKFGINVKVLSPLLNNGVQYWFDRVNEDTENGYVNGYINFSIAAEKLFTFKMTVSE